MGGEAARSYISTLINLMRQVQGGETLRLTSRLPRKTERLPQARPRNAGQRRDPPRHAERPRVSSFTGAESRPRGWAGEVESWRRVVASASALVPLGTDVNGLAKWEPETGLRPHLSPPFFPVPIFPT